MAQTHNESHELWEALRSKNHFVLMRHALAPGTGDPVNFDLELRETQRNLSAQGRHQAQRIGDRLRAHGIERAEVFSSKWFRCKDTAELLDLGPVNTLPALNSFFRNYEQKDAQTASLKHWLLQQDMEMPIILVTHQVNITALTGVYPASGEIVIVRRDAQQPFKVVGRIATDAFLNNDK